jgi:NADH-quinone oxidoreductase subunit F
VGSQRIVQILERIETGDGRPGDLDRLHELCTQIAGHTFCPLGDALAAPIESSLRLFEHEYLAHIDGHIGHRRAA